MAQGFRYVADADSRSSATSHPYGNLWDNGEDAVEELRHLLQVREIALARFSARNIRIGRPLARIEEVLVPIYLLHRFQVQAVGKLIGGHYFNYRLRGDTQEGMKPVPAAQQQEAIDALLALLDPAVLRLPETLATLIPPRVPNDPKSRETFGGATGINFDALAPARASVALTLRVLLDRSRGARLARSGAPGFEAITQGLLESSWYARPLGGIDGALQRQTSLQVLYELLRLALDVEADGDVRALALDALDELERWLAKRTSRDVVLDAHYAFARHEIRRLLDDPAAIDNIAPVRAPPGSPIGSAAE
ncbi:MAG: zinc-dependent metalloprotease [Woeseiaceae bacterium]